MKLGFQGNNGKLVLTADNLKFACHELGIPDDKHTLRRIARGFDIYYSGKVHHVEDHSFLIESQYDRQEPYKVKIKQTPYLKAGGYAYCTCQDWMNYSGDQDLPDVNFWCKHSISALLWLHEHSNGNGTKKVVNECGTPEAKALQDKMNPVGNTNGMNGQLDSSTGGFVTADNHHDNGNGAQAPSQPQLDISDPFQESEQLDIDQIEGLQNREGGLGVRVRAPSAYALNPPSRTLPPIRSNGELVHKLSNGEYVISYKGIMTLSEKHHITFETATHSETHTVIAKGRCGTSERVSGKPVNGNEVTAMELAKRNAARQLLPLVEIKGIECKAKLNAEFDWQTAYTKCVELVGTKAIVDIIINDLVNWGKLRQDNPSGYNRTEWLLIHEYCQKEASISRDPGSTNNWSYNSSVFIDRCREAIQKVRDDNTVEANELPMEGSNGKRKLQMDKKLRTWLIEADGTKKAISCREICEKFSDGSIVTRLRAGIDSGADISTVEID